jgi:hypothetical protein
MAALRPGPFLISIYAHLLSSAFPRRPGWRLRCRLWPSRLSPRLGSRLARSRRFRLVYSLRPRPHSSRSSRPRSLGSGPRMPRFVFALVGFHLGPSLGSFSALAVLVGASPPGGQPPSPINFNLDARYRCRKRRGFGDKSGRSLRSRPVFWPSQSCLVRI